jgi:hypothetical protein
MRWWAILILLCVVPREAGAADASPQDKQRARQLYQQGVKAARQKHLQMAVRLLKQAYRHWKRPKIQRSLALICLEMKDRLAAARHLRIYLRTASAAQRRLLPAPLGQLLRQVGTIVVRVSRPGVTFWLDGRRPGHGPGEHVVLPGRHTLELRSKSRVLVHEERDIKGGQTLRWAPGLPAMKRIDPRRRPRPGGKVRRPGRGRIHWGYFVTAASLAVAAGAALIYTGVKTLELEDEHARRPHPELRSLGLRYKRAADALMGVTATCAAAAVVLAVLTRWKNKERSAPVTLAPSVTPGGAFLLLRGGF